MQAHFTKLRDYLYSLRLDLPYTNQQIVDELSKETWLPDEAGYGQNSFPTRFKIRSVQGTIAREIEQYIEHGDFKQRIIDTLYQEDLFPGHWGVGPERMNEMTYLYGSYTLDHPGYSIRVHTDDRMHVVQGMIYFIDRDDPARSTTFYSTKNLDDPIRITTGPALGFMGANLNNSWHTGENSSNELRYSMIYGLRLNL